MLINNYIAISTSSILLVPYEASHVPTYHEWMKDEKIQAETASEPLTLEEEYTMQKSWRTDADKLTFIVCLPLTPVTPRSQPQPQPQSESQPLPTTTLPPNAADSPTHMIGDVNLFLTPSPTTPSRSCIGELELMIAPTAHRQKGHGRAAILAFLSYISAHLPSILAEYSRRGPPEGRGADVRLEGLRVKIGEGNAASLRLFRGLGFGSEGGEEKVNYFGELELWFRGEFGEEEVRRLRERWEVEGFRELGYSVEGKGKGKGSA